MADGSGSTLGRLFPSRADNSFDGYRAALWLLGSIIALKLAMSINSILNTRSVAVGADGFRLESFGDEGARAVLMLFSLMSLGQLMLALIALTILIRWRALVPFIYLVLLAEQLARRFIVQGYAVARADGAPDLGFMTFGLLALLALGLALSLIPARGDSRDR